MKLTRIALASTDHDAVRSDVEAIYNIWLNFKTVTDTAKYTLQEGTQTLKISEKSGDRIDIIPIHDRELEAPEYDDKGNITKERVLAGELRVDIIIPKKYEIPKLDTRVFPKVFDMNYK